MMTSTNLKRGMAGLLVLTGVLHVIVGLTGDVGTMKTGVLLFGVAYFLLGLFVYSGAGVAVRTAMVFTALGLALGSYNYFQHGGPASLLVMFAIDMAVLVLGGVWHLNSRPAD